MLSGCNQKRTAHYACRSADLNLMPVAATTNGFIFQIIDSLMESIASMYLLGLKRGLAILLIFRLPGILSVWKCTHESRAATLLYFSKC